VVGSVSLLPRERAHALPGGVSPATFFVSEVVRFSAFPGGVRSLGLSTVGTAPRARFPLRCIRIFGSHLALRLTSFFQA